MVGSAFGVEREMSRKHVLIAATAVVGILGAIPSAGGAAILFSGWYYSTLVGPAAGESAVVAAGILYDTIPSTAKAPTYDYIYEVWNTGTVPIADFGGGPGKPPAVGGPTYNSDIFFGMPGFPASGPVRNLAGLAPMTGVPPAQARKRLPGGWGGANNPYLGSAPATPYTALYPGSRGLRSPNYQYWGFTKYNSVGGYEVIWYNLVSNQIFGKNRVTRFDLNSVFGPVPGAFMDPPGDPMSTTYFDIGWTNGDALENILTPVIPDPAVPGNACDPTDPACSAFIIPPQIASQCPSCTGYGFAPEPASWTMMLLGVAGLGAAMRTRMRPPTLA
jgi:hypothetical protein